MGNLKNLLIDAVVTASASSIAFLCGYFYNQKRMEKSLDCDGEINIIESNGQNEGFYLKLPNDSRIDVMKKKPYAIFKVKIVVDDKFGSNDSYDA